MASMKERLWRVLKLVLPKVDFDSEPVEYFLGVVEKEDVTENEMAEAFGPFLQSYGVVTDDDDEAITDVCRTILRRLRNERFWSPESAAVAAPRAAGGRTRQPAEKTAVEDARDDAEAVAGLDAWLVQLKLTAYRDQAFAWCKKMGAVDIEEVIENCEDFSEDMGLKPLEHKRVMKAKTEKNGKSGAQAAASAVDKGDASRAPTAPKGGYPAPKGADTARRKEVVPEAPQNLEVQCLKKIGEEGRQYYLVEKIGEGVSAIVYKAVRYEEGEPREYAVKAVSLSKLLLHGDVKRISMTLKREIDVLFTLRHKNIVSLYDVIEQEGKNLYLILELVSGGDLFEYIVRNGPLEENEARFVFLQLVDALKHIHSKGIVHRDLKPENILIHAQANGAGLDVKISDFGHSKLVNDGYSVAVSKVGTPQYWAPEVSDVRHDRKSYDERADLWSLGVVLYVMLEGTYPFDGVTARMEEQIRRAEVNFKAPNRPTREAREVIQGLIKVKPEERFSLEQLRKKPFVRGDEEFGRVIDMVSDSARQQVKEETIELPRVLSEDPSDKKNVKQFRMDLQNFNAKYKHGAKLSGKREVSVTWRSEDKKAKDELFRLLDFYFPGAHFPDSTPAGLDHARGSLAPVKEAASWQEAGNATATPKSRARGNRDSFRIIGPFKLTVDQDLGAGLDLRETANGMVVDFVDDAPGQPKLRAGDLITKIESVGLGPNWSSEKTRETFGKHFRDGAMIWVKRKST